MRIIKEFNLGYLKATLFIHEEKYSLKLEDEFGAVNYKFGRLEGINVAEIPDYFKIPKIEKSVIDAFMAMRTGRDEMIQLLSSNSDLTRESII